MFKVCSKKKIMIIITIIIIVHLLPDTDTSVVLVPSVRDETVNRTEARSRIATSMSSSIPSSSPWQLMSDSNCSSIPIETNCRSAVSLWTLDETLVTNAAVAAVSCTPRHIHSVSQKNVATLVVNNFYKPEPILMIFWHTMCRNYWLLNARTIFNITLATLLHYLRKH